MDIFLVQSVYLIFIFSFRTWKTSQKEHLREKVKGINKETT